MTSKKLLDSDEINQLESRFISLFERTIKKGFNTSGPKLKNSIKKQFKTSTFQKQIDSILDDIVLYTVDYTDKELSKLLKAAINSRTGGLRLSASETILPLTEEAVRQSLELSELIADSIIEVLKDEAVYQESPADLARRVLDLWGGEKYRAVRFARTFSADVATSTALNRYKNNGIEEIQFYAKIDERTSPQCRAMHGTVFKSDSAEAKRYSCPLHHHCLVAGTKIKTVGGDMNIEDIQTGAAVLTHLNNYMPVTDTMERYADDIIEISTAKRSIKLTPEHPVLTKRNDLYLWVRAGELKEKDEMVII